MLNGRIYSPNNYLDSRMPGKNKGLDRFMTWCNISEDWVEVFQRYENIQKQNLWKYSKTKFMKKGKMKM
jgi:hypothetical protein